MNEDFIAKVREMRTTQKQYFKLRDRGVLMRSKELERQVDEMLAELGNPQKTLL